MTDTAESTTYYFINQLLKRKELTYIQERKKKANNYPQKKYFINPIKITENEHSRNIAKINVV